MSDFTWENAPTDTVLWGVYGPSCFPTVFACLITDSVLAANDGFGIRPPAWPFGHFWHGWAIGEASRVHGAAAVGTFARAIHDFYYEKAHGRLAPHGVGA
jgi:hypothetical protein